MMAKKQETSFYEKTIGWIFSPNPHHWELVLIDILIWFRIVILTAALITTVGYWLVLGVFDFNISMILISIAYFFILGYLIRLYRIAIKLVIKEEHKLKRKRKR